ncbi:hypothetical protein MMC17_007071 [Xylographa soralifera]|nr:hypothetical protein [Xylographa soralifera]
MSSPPPPLLIPLPDATGFRLTPTIHSRPSALLQSSPSTTLPPNYSVLVLGASRGIGLQIAVSFASAGAQTVIVTGRDVCRLTNAGEECCEAARQRSPAAEPSMQVLAYDVDVCDAASMARLAQLLSRDLPNTGATAAAPRLDAVIVNASYYGPVLATTVAQGHTDDFRQAMDTNVLGAYHAARYFGPMLRSSGREPDDGWAGKRPALFVAVNSVGAWMVEGEIAHVAACVGKLAQARLVEMLAEQYRGEGGARVREVLCAAVHPGFVATEMSSVVEEGWRSNLVDDPALCGAFCVWLAHDIQRKMWLSGRWLNAKWDVDELCAMKEKIVNRGMLKARMVVQ